MDARGFTGLLAELCRAGAESHMIYEAARGDLPDSLASTVRSTGLHGGTGEGDWTRVLPGLVASIQPQTIWVHDDVHGQVTQWLNHPNRPYGLWWWLHDHRMSCLTGLRARPGDREWLCSKPLSIDCFGEIELKCCLCSPPDRRRAFLFTDYLSRINQLLVLPSVDHVIVQNEYMADMLALNCPDGVSRVRVVPGIVSSGNRRGHAPRKKRNRREVLFHGSLSPESGLHLAIRALAEVYADLPVLFHIIAEGNDTQYFDLCVKLAAKSQAKNSTLSIQFEDCDSASCVQDLYRDADVVVMPDQWGAVSNVPAARAIMAGAAVVTTGVGAPGTLLRQTGFLVGNNQAELAEGIWTLLIDSDLRNSIVRQGMHQVRRYFSPERQLEEIRTLIAEHAAPALHHPVVVN
jgi:glycosyltransferase involved in cell wall biosynthesis